jgi:hypothetical protein
MKRPSVLKNQRAHGVPAERHPLLGAMLAPKSVAVISDADLAL